MLDSQTLQHILDPHINCCTAGTMLYSPTILQGAFVTSLFQPGITRWAGTRSNQLSAPALDQQEQITPTTENNLSWQLNATRFGPSPKLQYGKTFSKHFALPKLFCYFSGTGLRVGKPLNGSVVKVVVGASKLLFPVLDRLHLVDAGPVIRRVSPEGDIQVLQEKVHPCTQANEFINHHTFQTYQDDTDTAREPTAAGQRVPLSAPHFLLS